MFLGHFGVGFGAKKLVPQISLGSLFLASQFIDLLWPTFLLLGVEVVKIDPHPLPGAGLVFVSYPVSHSLLAVCGWALMLAALFYLRRRRVFEALVLGSLVISHWLLDLIVHFPDLPLFPGADSSFGLALWSRPYAAMVLEFMIFAAGVIWYRQSTRPKDLSGRWGFRGLVLFLGAIQLANFYGPPPPDAGSVAWAGQAQWLLVAWGYWLDRHRRPAGKASEAYQ